MARGWQSNAAEGPVETRKVGRDARKLRTPKQLEQLRKAEDLQLSRTRVLHDIEASHNPRYTQMLTQALAHLDQELSRLST